jgi:hypothetical protein
MERFWRTLRSRCLDHLPSDATLHDLNAALLAFLDADYQGRPHAGLLGDRPIRVFREGITALPSPKTAKELAHALEVHTKRKVRNDCTFSVESRLYEVSGRHLAGKAIEVVLDPFTDLPLRATYQGTPIHVGPCDATANSRRRRPVVTTDDRQSTIPFDPIAALLAAARKESSNG